MLTRLITFVCASAFLASCLLVGLAETDTSLSGIWGGEHISLELRVYSSSVEYDCAHGTIDEPIEPDHNGSFVAVGTHVFEQGGPIREDKVPDAHPARYNGVIRGLNMTLTITLTDTGTELGLFLLERGKAGMVFKCL